MGLKKIWRYLSYLGIEEQNESLKGRSNILSNQINIVLFVLILFLILVTSVRIYAGKGNFSPGIYRLYLMLIVNGIIFLLARKSLFRLNKYLLIYFPLLILFVYPTVVGFVEQESFFYYPISILALSILPQLLFNPLKQSVSFVVSLIFFFVSLLFLFEFLSAFSSVECKVVQLIKDFYFFYVAIPLIVFGFIHISIFYLHYINFEIENKMLSYNDELNAALEELKTAQQQLVLSEKLYSLETLVSGVAHEINNPLNFINGGIELLENSLDDFTHLNSQKKEDIQSSLEMIKTGFERTSYIVSTLLNFSSKDNQKLTKLSVNKIIEDTLLFFGKKLHHKIKLDLHLEYCSEIYAYKDKLYQVFVSILENALVAVETVMEEKVIIIETQETENEILVRIENNGLSLSQEEMNHLFDPFYTTKEPGKGTGMGLAICYNLIAQHHGKIYAKNTTNGVAFFIEISKRLNT